MTDSADAFAYAFPGGPKYKCPKCGKRDGEFKDSECLKCTIDGIEASIFNAAGVPPGNGSAGNGPSGFDNFKRASEAFKQRFYSESSTFSEADWARLKAKQSQQQRQAPPPPPKASSPLNLDAEMLRRLIQLCHPDKHANSLASQKATHFLLDIKAALDKAK